MGTAQTKYDKANTRTFSLKFNKKTDEELINKLLSEKNVQGYLKSLIRKDIKRLDNK